MNGNTEARLTKIESYLFRMDLEAEVDRIIELLRPMIRRNAVQVAATRSQLGGPIDPHAIVVEVLNGIKIEQPPADDETPEEPAGE